MSEQQCPHVDTLKHYSFTSELCVLLNSGPEVCIAVATRDNETFTKKLNVKNNECVAVAAYKVSLGCPKFLLMQL